MAHQCAATATESIVVPLRLLIKPESHPLISQEKETNQVQAERGLILQKTTAAYGILRALIQLTDGGLNNGSPEQLLCTLHLDNFSVLFSSPTHSSDRTEFTWKDITRVDMISPSVVVNVAECSFHRAFFGDSDGKYFEDETESVQCSLDASIARFLGGLLYELFSGQHPLFSEKNDAPERKRSASTAFDQTALPTGSFNNPNRSTIIPLIELGLPSPLSFIVGNLLEPGSGHNQAPAYMSLSAVCEDLRLLINDPSRFLFNNFGPSPLTNVGCLIWFREDKLYGRDSEVDQITDAFCRVSGGGKEAIFISGLSGSGKTRLVKGLIDRIRGVGGFVVSQKINLFEQDPFSAILSAFSALCSVIKKQSSREQLIRIGGKLMNEFSADFTFLAQLLPGIHDLFPMLKSEEHERRGIMQMESIIFILQRFLRAVSSKRNPVMWFIDDLQWINAKALKLFEGALSGDDNSACLLFVGSFRSNEVESDHELHNTIKNLQASRIRTTLLKLGGIKRADLNMMISDALCVFPRISLPISDAIFQCTAGNPFFARQSLQSLVRKSLISFSVHEQCWVWNIDEILSSGLSGDIISLLTAKIREFSSEMQSSLIMLSLVTKVSDGVAKLLSSTSQYPNIIKHFEDAVENGTLVKCDGYFNFTHDKIREAVFNLVPRDQRGRHHFNLAVVLHLAERGDELDDVEFLIADQFSKSPQFLDMKHSFDIDIPKLFCKASLKALNRFDFPLAIKYSRQAESLLSERHWNDQHDLCIDVFYQLAKSANSQGFIDEAKNSIKQIIVRGRSLEETLDAYSLLVNILFANNEGETALSTCREILSQLGESIPSSLQLSEIAKKVKETSVLLASVTDQDVLAMDNSDKKSQNILKFYSHLANLTFWYSPQSLPFCVCRMIELTLDKGSTVFSAIGFAQYGVMLCNKQDIEDITTGLRVGKLSLNFQQKFTMTEHLPRLYLWYYAFIAEYNEAFQTCADMHRHGFEVGMSTGDYSFALMNAIMSLRGDLLSGANLTKLRKKTDYYLELATKFGHSISLRFMTVFRETISVLIGDDSSTNFGEERNQLPVHEKNKFLQFSVRCFWHRHYQRFEYFFTKFLESKDSSVNKLMRDVVVFLRGLNIFQSGKGITITSKIGKESLASITILADRSRCNSGRSWNFDNKVHLLKAELFSHKRQNKEAEDSYQAAIEASRHSGFVHEEGLSCELAGLHFFNIGKTEKAMAYFTQARKCYCTWGSRVKMDFISSKIAELGSS